MTRESIEMYAADGFDHEAHIAEFLSTSADYLGVNADHVITGSNRAWQQCTPICAEEAHYA